MEQTGSEFNTALSFDDDLLATAIQTITTDVSVPQKVQEIHIPEIQPSLHCYQQITEKGEQIKMFGLLLQELRTLNQRLGGLEQTLQPRQTTFSPEAVTVPLKFTMEPLQIPVNFSGDKQPVVCQIKPTSSHRHRHQSRENSKEEEETRQTLVPKKTSVSDTHSAFKRPKIPPPPRTENIRKRPSKHGSGACQKKIKM